MKNHRPMSLISVLYLIFTKITLHGITGAHDLNKPREQAGFRKGYSPIDKSHAVNKKIQKSAKHNQALY